jgi:type IV pilus assembly protein PilB
MAEAKKLGDLLKEAGLIDDFQLQSALSHQRNWGGKLGSILIELEFVNEEELARVIAEKLRLPHANLFEPEIPESVINLIKPEVAKKYHVVPVKQDKNVLMLAMADPLDINAIDGIRFATGLNIKPALALESEIRDAIRKYYEGEVVVRKQKPTYPQAYSAGGKMEFIRGSDLCMPKTQGRDANASILSKDESVQQTLLDSKLRIDALITLLIEKELITREELVSMIYQKKLGM